MAARIRPPVPYGKDAMATAGARLLDWIKAHPFDRERLLEQVWHGRLVYSQAMRRK